MRAAPAILAAALASTGCAQDAEEDCAGETLAVLELHGERDDAATGCVVPPEGGWVVPATLPDVAPTDEVPVPTFTATIKEAGGALSYCTRGAHAAVLRGARTGDHLRVEVVIPGAVFGACAATCRPRMTEVVEGDLVPGAGDAPATFTGALTETFDGGAGPCGACALPCTSRYVLTGTAK